MKLEVGNYIRNEDGYILKLTKENIYGYKSLIGNSNIKIKSHNIIDLIKIGDYVNGFKVTGLDYQYTTKVHKLSCNNEYGQEGILIIPSEIRNVVTKEQFDSITYEVEQ